MDFTRREGIVMWIPGLVAGLYVILTSTNNPVAGALAVMVSITLLGGLAAAIADSVANTILGEGTAANSRTSSLGARHLMSGLILVSATWILWQVDRQSDNTDLLRCVESRMTDLAKVRASALVKSCLDEPEEDSRDQG